MKNLLLIACLALAPMLASCGKNNDPVFDAKVRAYLLENPEVIQEAMVALQEKQEKQALAEAQAKAKEALPLYRASLERDPRDFVVNPNGKITVTEFFDYRCPPCKRAAPEVLKLIEGNPDVRFVFKEYPIFGGVSDQASAAALTATSAAQYVAVYQSLFAAQKLDEAAISRIVQAAGMDPSTAAKAMEDPKIQRHLVDNHALAQALGVRGTPAFFIGDEVVAGADLPAIRAAIERARKKV